MPRVVPLPDLDNLYGMYQAGESTVDLAKRFNCHSSTLRKMFKRHGLAVRSMSECRVVENARVGRDVRLARVRNAHAAVRGSRRSLESLVQAAGLRAQRLRGLEGCELQVNRELVGLGFAPVRESACGPYNIDFAISDTIAVECFGGGWHASGSHAIRHQKRVRHLIDAGWNVVIVWVQTIYSDQWISALKDTIREVQEACTDPSALRQYRVIWGNGEVLSRSADSDDFPCKPPFEMGRDAKGRYYRIR